MPSSLAVISSDAKEVIYHRLGLDPEAAQLLEQTLQFHRRCSGVANASTSVRPADKSPSTFLAALLGPEVEAVALREAREKRFWKGTVSRQLRTEAPSWEISGHNSARQSPAEILCAFPDATLGKDSSSSVPKQAAQATGPWAQNTLPAELSHGASNSQQNTRSSKSVQWSVPEQPEAASKAFEGSGEASSVPDAAKLWLPDDAGTHSSHKVLEMHSRTLPEFAGGYLEPLKSCPQSHSFGSNRSAETHAVEEEGDRKESCSGDEARKEKRRPVRCKSANGRSRRGSLFRPEAIKQLVHESKNEEGTRTVALLKSISQARRNTISGTQPCVSAPQHEESKSEAIPCPRQWAEVQGFLSETMFSPADKAQQHSFEALDVTQQGSDTLYRQPSTVIIGQDIQKCKQEGNAGQNLQVSPPEQACKALQDPYLPGPPNTTAIWDGVKLALEPTNGLSPSQRPSPADRISGSSSQMLLCLHDCPLSFDCTVSMCRPEEGRRSPLLVVISNSTEHSQVRTTLIALAESQLELLSSTLPQHAIQFLATESVEAVPKFVGQLARAHQNVTIMFMDIVGFTQMSKDCQPAEVMVFLNTLFATFDRLVDTYGVHKVETAGDCYIVSGGIMSPTSQSGKGFGLVVEEKHDPKDSAKRVMEFAKSLLEAAGQVRMPNTHQPVRVRVGLHTGDVVTGLIGSKLPKFSVFGDTMCTASRMESTGVPGRIHVSETTHALLAHSEPWEATGGVDVKGKGLMNTYLWNPSSQHTTCQPTAPVRATSADGRLSCVQLMHTHALLWQNLFHNPFTQRYALQQHSASASPPPPRSRRTSEIGP
ncbi:hypothetical protein DUNSADRAFT_9561 [Dunaliella salina]|uniref:Guanylate cyclase domain-containing protein n=1 Tax=Dunaliella salina TaxID=3046 RepID=A0ABZ3KXQ1_DUNSA|nr:hypothetical protein DUNSADRAFT_9561 [Dunaliella salina]|eukprot:KAF5833949.1 hypothetical protein DUNSADRAFT_9561 [Dunaliella salina]